MQASAGCRDRLGPGGPALLLLAFALLSLAAIQAGGGLTPVRPQIFFGLAVPVSPTRSPEVGSPSHSRSSSRTISPSPSATVGGAADGADADEGGEGGGVAEAVAVDDDAHPARAGGGGAEEGEEVYAAPTAEERRRVSPSPTPSRSPAGAHSFVCAPLPTAGARFDQYWTHRRERGVVPPYSRNVKGLSPRTFWNISLCAAPAPALRSEEGLQPRARGMLRTGMSGTFVLTRAGERKGGRSRSGPGKHQLLVASACDGRPEYALVAETSDTYASLVVSETSSTQRYARSVAGPDELVATLTGPELLQLMPSSFNANTCRCVLRG